MYGNKCWQECRKRETVSIVGRMYIGAATKENSMEVPQKILELKKKKYWNYHTIQQSHFWVFFRREQKHLFEEIYAHLCS